MNSVGSLQPPHQFLRDALVMFRLQAAARTPERSTRGMLLLATIRSRIAQGEVSIMRPVLSRLGLPSLASAAGVGSAGMCASAPAMLAGPLTTAVLGGSAWILHLTAGVIFAPLSLVLLIRSFARHRQPFGLLIAGIGILLMLVHYLSHFHQGTHGDEPFMYIGAVLLFVGALLDWRAQRRLVLTQ